MRVSTGVQGFDDLTNGGLPSDRLYILSGPPGSGKTTFAVQFVARGVEEGERALFISMHETAAELARSMAGFTFDFERMLKSKGVTFVNVFDEEGRDLLTPENEGDYRTSVQNQIRQIQQFVAEYDVDRVVLDSTMLLRHFFSDEDSVVPFLTGLKRADATVLLISEMTDPSAYADDHYLAHGLIFLHNFLDAEAGVMRRGLQILKMRGTTIDTDVHPLEFSEHGLRVRPEERLQR